MVGEDFGGQGNSFLGIDDAVGPNFQRQFVIVDALAHAGAFHIEIDLEHRCVNRIDRNLPDNSFGQILLVALVRDIAPSLIQGQLHIEPGPFSQGGDVQLGIENLHFTVAFDGLSGHIAGAFRGDLHGFGPIAVELCHQAFNVQHDLGDIFFHTGDGGKFVDNAVDLDGFYGHARQAGEQHTPQAVAQSGAEAPLQRFHHEFAIGAVFGNFRNLNFGSFYLNHPRSSFYTVQ